MNVYYVFVELNQYYLYNDCECYQSIKYFDKFEGMVILLGDVMFYDFVYLLCLNSMEMMDLLCLFNVIVDCMFLNVFVLEIDLMVYMVNVGFVIV